MFASQTEIVQLLLLCCIVIQSCLLHEVGSSLTPLKAESKPPSEGATTDDGDNNGDNNGDNDGDNDEDDDGTSWVGNLRRIESNKPSGCRPRCRREETSTKKSKVPKAYRQYQNFPYFARLLKRRSVESYDQKQDYVQGTISRATLDGNRPLENVVSHVLDAVDGLIPSKVYPKDVNSTSPNVEMSVGFNCDSFWECARTMSLTIEISTSPTKPLQIKFRGMIGPPKRNARSATFGNDDSASRPVYASLYNIVRTLIKLNNMMNNGTSPLILNTGLSWANIILYALT